MNHSEFCEIIDISGLSGYNKDALKKHDSDQRRQLNATHKKVKFYMELNRITMWERDSDRDKAEQERQGE